MANKHMKIKSKSYIIRKLQNETKRYYYAPVSECPKSKTLTTPNAGKNVKQQELSFIADRFIKML